MEHEYWQTLNWDKQVATFKAEVEVNGVDVALANLLRNMSHDSYIAGYRKGIAVGHADANRVDSGKEEIKL